MANKACKFRIYPTEEQKLLFAKTFGCVRFIYNKMLEDKQAMAQTLHFGKSVCDNGWGMFTEFLRYKLEEQGKKLVKVDRFFASSQTCSCCGCKNSATKNLSLRAWDCPKCGIHHDRDVNAATNIRNEGMRIVFA